MSGDDVSGTLLVTIDESDQEFVISVAGEIDLATVESLDAALRAAERSDCSCVVVDLAAVSFIDCRGFNSLLAGRQALVRRNIELVVRNPQRQARSLFDVACKASRSENRTA